MDTPQNNMDFNNSEEESLDIKRWLSLFVTNWYWFVISLFIALTISYAINRYSPKAYTVTSTLLIKDQKSSGLSNAQSLMLPGGDIFKNQMNLNNEMGIIKSFTLQNKVMNELPDFRINYVGVGKRKVVESNMYTSSPFVVVCDSIESQPKYVNVNIEILSGSGYQLTIDGNTSIEKELKFGESFKGMGFNFSIISRQSNGLVFSPKSSNTYYFYFTDPGRLASGYMKKLNVSPINKDASIVTLSVSGPVMQQETDYLNKLMEVYIKYGLDEKNQTADSTLKFIENQLAILSDSLRDAEEDLLNFRSANKFFDLSTEGSLIQTKVEEAEKGKAAFELQLNYYNYLSDYLQAKETPGSIISPSVMGISDPALASMLTSFSNLQKEAEKIRMNIEAGQPAVALVRAQLEEARLSLSENVSDGINNLKKLIAVSGRKLDLIENELNTLPLLERKLINIQRKVDLNNSIYTFLLEKNSESGIAKASNIPDNRIIDKASAYSATQIKPTANKNYMMGFLLGLLIPGALLVIVELFNDKIIDKKDVEKKTKIPVIGYIGHSESASDIPVARRPGSSLAESFRSVRTSLKYYVKEDQTAVIAISSTISGEGKTFFSVNLAAIIGMLGKRVLLIGLDLRKPRMDKVFELGDEFGMSTYLSGNSSYEQLIQKTDIKNLSYVPAGPRPPNPSELIDSPRMREFLERAKREYDIILIDTPPVGIVTDGLLLSKDVDINIFIVRQRYTSRNSLDMMEQLRQQGELKNMAIVMNDISLSGYYGYGMRYNYYQGYGYHYGHSYYGSGYYGKGKYGYGYGYGRKKNKKGEKGYYTED